MKRLPSSVWRYVGALLVLLALAALASYTTVSFLEYHPQLQDAQDALSIVSLMLLSLSMGFLFLAGALGLWGISQAVEAESRRRIGLLVDNMAYVSDGVVAIDGQGRVVGSNPAARFMGARENPASCTLCDLYPGLTRQDLARLTDHALPQEVEVVLSRGHGRRVLRFRSEPGEGLTQVLISDVTAGRARELKARQSANLQLIGRLARGVAHDFNTILCAVAGHAALLKSRDADDASVQAIVYESERGAELARQLVELGRPGVDAGPGSLLDHINRAGDLLRVGVPESWGVQVHAANPLPDVSLGGRQLEQVLMNMGMLVVGEQGPGTIHLKAAVPRSGVDPDAVPVVRFQVWTGDQELPEAIAGMDPDDRIEKEVGVILSVLRSMVEEVGGSVSCYSLRDGRCLYDVKLPVAETARTDEPAGLPDELTSYMAAWSVLLACPRAESGEELARRMKMMGVEVESALDQVGVLAQVERKDIVFAGVVLDGTVLGDEAESVLRVTRKLQPSAGILLLDCRPDDLPQPLRDAVVFADGNADIDDLFKSVIRSRERRVQAAHVT
jgi:two-component system cell cycle sensor histidine kinase/response regulator CckA